MLRTQPRAAGLLGHGAHGPRPPPRGGRPRLRGRQDPGHLLGAGDHRGPVLGFRTTTASTSRSSTSDVPGRASCSPTSWTSTRSTGTATTRPATPPAWRRSAGGSRAPRRAGRRPAADHGGPRLRPDDAAHGSFARADAPARRGPRRRSTRPRREDIVRRPQSRRWRPSWGGHRGARGDGFLDLLGIRDDPPADVEVPRLDTRLLADGHPRRPGGGSRRPTVEGGGRPLTVDDPRTIVAAKRDGQTLDEDEVSSFVAAYARGDVSDALAAAFLMACLLNGLDGEETLAMTRAMVASGDTLDFSDLGAPAVDKHSTGEVAGRGHARVRAAGRALGLSWRSSPAVGAGRTGGTLDKLESIPGCGRTSRPTRSAGRWTRWAAPWQRGRPPSCRPTARSPALPRRDRHGAVGPADHDQRDVEEARGDHGPDPARRQGRVGAFMKSAEEAARAGGGVPQPRDGAGPQAPP